MVDDAPRRKSPLAVEEPLGWWIRTRLRRECRAEGDQARVWKAIGSKSSTISDIIGGKKGVGWESARKLARYWGMTLDALEQQAKDAWAEDRRQSAFQPTAAEHLPLAKRHGWADVRTEVERAWPTIPARILDEVGGLTLWCPMSPRLVRAVALRLLEAEEIGAADATAPYRREIEDAAQRMVGPQTGEMRRVAAPPPTATAPRHPAKKG